MRTLLTLLVVAASTAAAEPDPIALDAWTARGEYRFGEPVWLYVQVGNPGTAALSVENPHCSRTHTRIEITTPDGEMLPMTGPASCSTTILETIPPGTDMVYAFELLEFYGADGDDQLPFGILAPGEYEVRYRSGKHLSDAVGFEVLPLDPHDSIAFHAYVRVLSETRPGSLRESTEQFRSFVERYPESPYAAALLCRAGVVSDLFFDSKQARRDFERLLYLYPESGYTSVAVRHLAFGMGRGPAGHALLDRVPDELPGTLAADLADRVRARLAMERDG